MYLVSSYGYLPADELQSIFQHLHVVCFIDYLMYIRRSTYSLNAILKQRIDISRAFVDISKD